jgi:chromosome partitioning protein
VRLPRIPAADHQPNRGQGMAGRVITIAQQKGGAGKTTLAANLAIAWSLSGKRVAVVDIDPQGSLTQWFKAREATLGGATGLTHVQVAGWRTQKEVERLARDHDVVVIDSPPHAETEAKIAIRVASLVVVPVQPSPMDLWATKPTLDLAKAEKRAVLLVLNRVPPRGKVADLIIGKAGEMGVAVALTSVGNRTGFVAAMMEGRGLLEVERKGRGAEEMEELAAEILRTAK